MGEERESMTEEQKQRLFRLQKAGAADMAQLELFYQATSNPLEVQPDEARPDEAQPDEAQPDEAQLYPLYREPIQQYLEKFLKRSESERLIGRPDTLCETIGGIADNILDTSPPINIANILALLVVAFELQSLSVAISSPDDVRRLVRCDYYFAIATGALEQRPRPSLEFADLQAYTLASLFASKSSMRKDCLDPRWRERRLKESRMWERRVCETTEYRVWEATEALKVAHRRQVVPPDSLECKH